MDDNQNDTHKKIIDKIDKLYDNLSFMDKYGGSVFGFVIITLCVILVHVYYKFRIQWQPIKDDWVNQRCKPHVIPFAGFINKPKDRSILEFTQENFIYCTQDILKYVTGYSVLPIQYLIDILQNVYIEIKNALQYIRVLFNRIRKDTEAAAIKIYGRILNFTIPIQQMVLAIKDTFAKIQGAVVSALFSVLGIYYTLKSALANIVNVLITWLIILIAIVAPMLVFPPTAVFAIPILSVALSVAIPLGIMVSFFTNVLHIYPENPIPDIPSPPSICFDGNTLLHMSDQKYKKMRLIQVGDKLYDGSMVTAKMKFDARHVNMYDLYGVKVSGSHMVKYKNFWLHVRNHPDAKQLHHYYEQCIYCINTTSKTIHVGDICFADWDDLYEKSLHKITNVLAILEKSSNKQNIHTHLDGGFVSDTMISMCDGSKKCISEIEHGDCLLGDIKVLSLVEIEGMHVEKLYTYHLAKDPKHFIVGGPNLIYKNDNNIKTSTLFSNMIDPFLQPYVERNRKEKKIYHLLTDQGFFTMDGVLFYDYNSLVEFFLYDQDKRI